MIDKTFLQQIGLDGSQVSAVMSAVEKEHKLISALISAKISPRVILRIVEHTGLDDFPDTDDVAQLTIRVGEEWAAFAMKT